MDQFVPEVSREDIERILKRDFPVEVRDELREMIEQIDVIEKNRVILACMKNAAGDVRKLKNNLGEAEGYYREIIGEAEYPNYLKKMFRIDKLPKLRKQRSLKKTRLST